MSSSKFDAYPARWRIPKLVIPWRSPWKKRLPANQRRMLDAVASGSLTAPNWIPGWERTQEETLF